MMQRTTLTLFANFLLLKIVYGQLPDTLMKQHYIILWILPGNETPKVASQRSFRFRMFVFPFCCTQSTTILFLCVCLIQYKCPHVSSHSQQKYHWFLVPTSKHFTVISHCTFYKKPTHKTQKSFNQKAGQRTFPVDLINTRNWGSR